MVVHFILVVAYKTEHQFLTGFSFQATPIVHLIRIEKRFFTCFDVVVLMGSDLVEKHRIHQKITI